MTPRTTSNIVIGADENGFGSLAGPLVVSAVAVRQDALSQITARDSKVYLKRYDRMREVVAENRHHVLAARIVEIDPDRLCALGYQQSLALAYTIAIASVRRRLAPRYPFAYLDGDSTHGIPYATALVKGDGLHRAISLASVLGKLRQVSAMAVLQRKYPRYGFGGHNGYLSEAHADALVQYGMLPGVHRIPILERAFARRGIALRTVG